ncbi:hypothetical protein N657DRAFT_648216 [Parathielavia appendiculata]|uniref:RRM domain-containing protein n=1 Tax=Parathielavia appendiculata TaxID=2587402 RepID=A0AAN6TV99_9PEZI|nr:hypothetical protein N657DRAFT_648216 [Parathielavia appendiculata]
MAKSLTVYVELPLHWITDADIKQSVMGDRKTGRNRGFGFVTFTDLTEAAQTIQDMDERE